MKYLNILAVSSLVFMSSLSNADRALQHFKAGDHIIDTTGSYYIYLRYARPYDFYITPHTPREATVKEVFANGTIAILFDGQKPKNIRKCGIGGSCGTYKVTDRHYSLEIRDLKEQTFLLKETPAYNGVYANSPVIYTYVDGRTIKLGGRIKKVYKSVVPLDSSYGVRQGGIVKIRFQGDKEDWYLGIDEIKSSLK